MAGDKISIFANLDFKEKIKETKLISSSFIKSLKDSIIFQDQNIIAINKGVGLAVQGGSGIKTSIDDALPYLKDQNHSNPKLVHRLDKDTSGLLLIARNRESADLLSAAFKEKTIKKTYLALVKGIPNKESGTINMPIIKKYKGLNEKVYRDDENGKEAVTHYKIIKEYKDKNLSLLELTPITGRTHQIRVHLKEIGYPIIGDFKYGSKNTDFESLSLKKRLYLHSLSVNMSSFFGEELKLATHENLKTNNYLKVFE
jgi:23S rRNA pseudouridine955/2504/2580 synthase